MLLPMIQKCEFNQRDKLYSISSVAFDKEKNKYYQINEERLSFRRYRSRRDRGRILRTIWHLSPWLTDSQGYAHFRELPWNSCGLAIREPVEDNGNLRTAARTIPRVAGVTSRDESNRVANVESGARAVACGMQCTVQEVTKVLQPNTFVPASMRLDTERRDTSRQVGRTRILILLLSGHKLAIHGVPYLTKQITRCRYTTRISRYVHMFSLVFLCPNCHPK